MSENSSSSTLNKASAPATPLTEVKQPSLNSSAALTGEQLRICSFNLLAPCYKRMANSGRESDFPELMHERYQATFKVYADIKASVLCLQEFWFNDAFRAVYDKALGDTYDIHALKRTRKKADGVAICVQKASPYKVVDTVEVRYGMAGDRVALVLRLEVEEKAAANAASAASTAPSVTKQFLIANTHLTFPHHEMDYEMRRDQMEACVEAINLYVTEQKLGDICTFICGDFNLASSVEDDNVCVYLQEQGFVSTYYGLNKKRAGVTHLTHRGSEHLVDFIFMRNPQSYLVPCKSIVYPETLSSGRWNADWTVSDHRPILTTFNSSTVTEAETAKL